MLAGIDKCSDRNIFIKKVLIQNTTLSFMPFDNLQVL